METKEFIKMCGITAFLGSSGAFESILSSLSLLQNRGYDSAGICCINDQNRFVLHKYASTIQETAIQRLEKNVREHSNCRVGIGHTRWATHGAKTDTNAHPHTDTRGRLAVVHNGIIENYLEIKRKLIAYGIEFVSQTDTEVIPKLLEFYLTKELERTEGDYDRVEFEKSVLAPTIRELQGTWAIVVLFSYTPNALYLCKNGSPLVLGIDDRFAMVSSEALPLSAYFNHSISLNDGDIVSIHRTSDGSILFPQKREYTPTLIQNRISDTTCSPYEHWTLKEIYEQPESIMRVINMGGRLWGENMVKLGGLDSHCEQLIDSEHIVLLGCGTSFHASQIGAIVLRSMRCFTSVHCIDASEFTLSDVPLHGKTVFVLLSQSGETKDLHRCMEVIRKTDSPIVSIVNVVGSLIARESDCGIYLNAGREVGVASTKSFTSQVIALTLMAIWFSQNKEVSSHLRSRYIRSLRTLSTDVKQLLSATRKKICSLADRMVDVRQMFLLGRGSMKHVADEGSLKIKEIAYIHAEGYGAGSLKHGPFALIDSETVILLIAPRDENFSKMLNTAEEVHSRHARVILLTNLSTDDDFKTELFEEIIYVPSNEMFQSVLSILPLQLLAYEIAIRKGHNPDFPRNLAKVVTVDG